MTKKSVAHFLINFPFESSINIVFFSSQKSWKFLIFCQKEENNNWGNYDQNEENTTQLLSRGRDSESNFS